MTRAVIIAALLGCSPSIGADYEETIAACTDGTRTSTCARVIVCPETRVSIARFKVGSRPLVMEIDGTICSYLQTRDDGSSLWCCS